MSDDSFHCERCGAPLATPDSVCEQCKRDLAVPVAKPDPAIGKYRCPECACKFDEPNIVLYPEKGPWYWPKDFKPRCPHCRRLLRDRASYGNTPIRITLLIFVISQLFESNWRRAMIGFLFFAGVVGLFFYFRYFRSEYRYTAAKRQKPSKQ